MIKHCKNCGTEFESDNPRRLCCTDDCSKHGGRPKAGKVRVECVICGKVAMVRKRNGGAKTCGDVQCVARHKKNVKVIANARWREANPNYKSPNVPQKRWTSTRRHGYPSGGDVSLWYNQEMAFKIHPCKTCGKPTKTMYCSKRCQWIDANKRKSLSLRGRISRSISRRLYGLIKNDERDTKFCEKHLGYTWDTLKAHLESTFRPHMTWDNYGSEWHIDHIIPMALHDFSKDKAKAIKVAYALDNLMARWATTAIARSYGDSQIGNINKGDKLCA